MAYPLSSFIRRNAKITFAVVISETLFVIYHFRNPNREMDWYDEKKVRLLLYVFPILFVCALVYDFFKMKRLHSEIQSETET